MHLNDLAYNAVRALQKLIVGSIDNRLSCHNSNSLELPQTTPVIKPEFRCWDVKMQDPIVYI